MDLSKMNEQQLDEKINEITKEIERTNDSKKESQLRAEKAMLIAARRKLLK